MSEDKFEKLKHISQVRTLNNEFRELTENVLNGESLSGDSHEKLKAIIDLLDAYREAHSFAMNLNLDLHSHLKEYVNQKKSEGPVTEAESKLTNNLFELLKSGKESLQNFKEEPDLSVFSDLIRKK